MLKNLLAPVVALLLALVSLAAHAFVDPPVLVPDHPMAGQTVSVSIRVGVCDAFIERPGFPKITQTGSAIHIVLAALHYTDPAICVYPIGTNVTAVGAFPAGSYTLQVDREYQDLFNGDTVETLGTLPFTVAATPAPAVAAPSLNAYGFAALFMVLLGIGALALRRRGMLLIAAAIVIVPLTARAQTPPSYPAIAVLISSGAAAPTPNAVVNYYKSQPTKGPVPLQGLMVQNPQQVYFLLPRRASGDFLTYLQANPGSLRAQLERYVIVGYAPTADIPSALTALRSDPNVEAAYVQQPVTFSSVELTSFTVGADIAAPSGQYGRDALNIDAAWQLAGGYALIGDVDSGLATVHAALQQFSGSQYVGGNFIPIASLDLGNWPNGFDGNVDEEKPIPLPPNSICNPQHLPAVPPSYSGHGTHVSGLLAANGDAGLGVSGICKHCGVAMWKITNASCDTTSHKILVNLNGNAIPAAITFLADTGAQVVNMSFGGDRDPHYCANNATDPWCIAMTYANARDIVLVGASGNQRSRLQFPASDTTRVIAAGGFDPAITLWNDSPGSNTYCPYPGGGECGSNYTTVPGDPMQELMGSAKTVLSTTYPGYNWNPQVECGDQFPGPGFGNGVGDCTGTSMSSPQVAGVAGLVRSINPLVPVGKPTFNPLFEKATLRYVLASTTADAQANHPWNPTFGYGRPDAAAAARKMLGKVAGATIRNRVTPLFRLYSSAAHDYADVTSPQYAIALMINQANAYQPQGALVPNYSNFPTESRTPPLAAPRAPVYVMTTEVKPRNEWPGLVPLYLMDKQFTSTHDDFMLATTVADIQQAHADGYNLRNIQGYIYQTCTPEPQCIPPAAQKFYRECNTAVNDCAMFLESERNTFEAAGYTSAYPSGSNKVLGYAYPATDTDGDGLPDGFEYVVGTNPNAFSSNGDGSSDATKIPMVGVEISDPCLGGATGAANCPGDIIFKNGFDPF